LQDVTAPLSKTQVDRVGDRLREGPATDPDLRLLDAFRRTFAPAYESVITTVKNTLTAEVTGRPAKSTTSIIEKLRRESIRLTQIQDIAGCRFVVSDIRAQDKAVDQLLDAIGDVTIIDRRESPSHGYRAVHVVAAIQGKPIEVQVRTTLQHLWAELSEKAADIFDPGIKYGTGPAQVLSALTGFSALITEVERDELELQGSAPDPELDEIKRDLRVSLEGLIQGTAALRKKRRG
jgi:putative GTP pyrophosphokinase